MCKVIFRICRLQSLKKIIASRKSGGIINHENAKPESSQSTGAWDLFHQSSSVCWCLGYFLSFKGVYASMLIYLLRQ